MRNIYESPEGDFIALNKVAHISKLFNPNTEKSYFIVTGIGFDVIIDADEQERANLVRAWRMALNAL